MDTHNCLDLLVLRTSTDRYPEKTVEVTYYECRKCGARYEQAEVDAMWSVEA